MMQTTPTWVDTEAYPFAPNQLTTADGNIHYIDVGSGEPVVFVHGSPDWSFSFRRIIQEVSKHYRCIAIDHLGFGLSDKPIDGDYRAEAHAHRLEQLFKSLKLSNIRLVLHDWGGPIGMSYAVQHPENIKSLVIINSWAWPVNKDWYYQAFSGLMGGVLGRFLIRQRNIFIHAVVPRLYAEQAKLTPAMHMHLLMPFSTKEARRGMETFPGAIIKETPWLTGIWNKRSMLANKPLLILWGLKDIAVRKKELEQWQKAFPQAQVHTFADVGHFPHEEYPDKTGQLLLTFLQQQESLHKEV
jgi:haloalkane dehalogenase